jgi:hypothetical protein
MKLKLALLASGIIAAAGITAAHAAPYGMAGCGLGSVIIGADGFIQVFAATTNGTSASQTFGITTGTSNCVRSGVVLADKEQEAFFEANFAELQRDIAAGGGDHLSGLSELFSCTDEVRPTVNEVAQQSYEMIFPNGDTSPVHALYMLKVSLSRNDAIAAACIL